MKNEVDLIGIGYGLSLIVAGAYKGYMKASGIEVDSTIYKEMLAGFIAYSTISSAVKTKISRDNRDPAQIVADKVFAYNHKRLDQKPLVVGLSNLVVSGPLGLVELGVGFGLGYMTKQVLG